MSWSFLVTQQNINILSYDVTVWDILFSP
jgi:hypothetical protein